MADEKLRSFIHILEDAPQNLDCIPWLKEALEAAGLDGPTRVEGLDYSIVDKVYRQFACVWRRDGDGVGATFDPKAPSVCEEPYLESDDHSTTLEDVSWGDFLQDTLLPLLQ